MLKPIRMDSTLYPPSQEFQSQAHISSENLAHALSDTARLRPEDFWKELSKALRWQKPYSVLREGQGAQSRFFIDGQINVSENCLDRHLKNNAKATALVWRSESRPDGSQDRRELSYQDLFDLTCRIANFFKTANLKKGDRVLLYLPMTPELVASMLACARLGLVHTVVFAGFSAQSIADRLEDSGARLVVTADGFQRKGRFVELKKEIDKALNLKATAVEKVLILQRDPARELNLVPARDLLWKDAVESQSPKIAAETTSAEDPLFILYTSGTTGKPKGLFHTHGGYGLWAHWTTRWLFDIKPDDTYWCSADCGWVTGHTYLTYGPLSNGARVFIYEGAPTWPEARSFFEILDREKISILYTSPTAIRMLMSSDQALPLDFSFEKLRLLGTVGEPINPEAWRWYHSHIGKNRCPVVDTYWQTETGGAMIAPFPGCTPLKAGSASFPLPGINARIVNPETGEEVKKGDKGALVFADAWPSMARGIWGDPVRFEKTYWDVNPALKGMYVTGDLAFEDKDGFFWISGRMDDVMNVSGHRIGSAEVESALVECPEIFEAAVVGINDPVRGQALVAFVEITQETYAQLTAGTLAMSDIQNRARDKVGEVIGSFARPSEIRVVRALPKTRSGKIMRRLLRELAQSGTFKGDTSTLEDFSVESLTSESDNL